MPVTERIAAVTEKIVGAQPRYRAGAISTASRKPRKAPRRAPARLRQSRAWLRRLAVPATRRCCANGRLRQSRRSSPPITTCSRRISPSSASRRSSDEAAREAGGTAQVAGGVPAMCDGVTQGEAGMELSLFSRDVIALSTAVALSHQMFDAAVYLGVCDKIVPGLVIGALASAICRRSSFRRGR